jgi:8-oxo-dGTP pyrophosphatase MutT (NUDIX family)
MMLYLARMSESQSPQKQPALRPRDAATLILVRRDAAQPRVLMGKRHESHKFMPGKYVFPGGRVDLADCRVQPSRPLEQAVAGKLLSQMRGRPSEARAQGLAMAAVRETFEEVGYVVGTPGSIAPTRSSAWSQFHQTGHGADLSGLKLLARAITPPGRPRRFDTRFFIADASVIANPDSPLTPETDELLTPHWVTIEEARLLDLPWITGQILKRLEALLERRDALSCQHDCTFQFMRGKDWQYVTL